MTKSKFAFGDFTFDPDTGTLRRRNRDQHLPEQTARLLGILLERANSLVTREELRQVLWPTEEFLDYDQGINVAVNRLRAVLRDDPRSPQFLKTIPKRGYSFSSKVTLVPRDTPLPLASPVESPETESALDNKASVSDPDAASSTEIPAETTDTPAASPGDTVAAGPSFAVPARPARRRLVLGLTVTAAVVLFAIAWIVYRRVARPSEQVVRLGIASFQLQGNPEIDSLSEGFRLSLSDDISRLPKVQVCSFEALKPAQRSILDLPFSSQQLSLDDILLGSLVKQGDGYDLKFELVRAADSVHLASFEYSGARQDLPGIRERLQHDLFYYLDSRAGTVQAINGSTNDPRGLPLLPPGPATHATAQQPKSPARGTGCVSAGTGPRSQLCRSVRGHRYGLFAPQLLQHRR